MVVRGSTPSIVVNSHNAGYNANTLRYIRSLPWNPVHGVARPDSLEFVVLSWSTRSSQGRTVDLAVAERPPSWLGVLQSTTSIGGSANRVSLLSLIDQLLKITFRWAQQICCTSSAQLAEPSSAIATNTHPPGCLAQQGLKSLVACLSQTGDVTKKATVAVAAAQSQRFRPLSVQPVSSVFRRGPGGPPPPPPDKGWPGHRWSRPPGDGAQRGRHLEDVLTISSTPLLADVMASGEVRRPSRPGAARRYAWHLRGIAP